MYLFLYTLKHQNTPEKIYKKQQLISQAWLYQFSSIIIGYYVAIFKLRMEISLDVHTIMQVCVNIEAQLIHLTTFLSLKS